MMNLQQVRAISRRQMLSRAGIGFGAAALSVLEASHSPASSAQASGLLAPKANAKAKRAIYLFMSGAPSQIDLWDPKPQLEARFNEDLPESIRQGQRLTTMTSDQSRFPIAPSMFRFSPSGKSGILVSELLSQTAKNVDDIALIRSTHTEAINHDPAITFACTGDAIPGKASLGSWLSYGLGAMNEDLPAFMVMTASWSGRGTDQAIFNRLWGNGFLPSQHQGVRLHNGNEPFLFLKDPKSIDQSTRRRMLDSLARLNQEQFSRTGDPETTARIEQYEMAFRMQTSVPDLANLSDEPQHVLDLYGPEVTRPGTFAHCCLLARRMAERGVRFTQIFHRGWDQHLNLPRDLRSQCRDIDQPSAGLLTDLRNRGLLDDTLVIWGGEFGRTTYCQGPLTTKDYGRDHHPRCFSVWLAGAGIRGGHVHGETDEFSYNVTRDPVHVQDLHATILERFGIDHWQFTYPWKGLDQRLTGVERARVVEEILS
jgi:hypothetical protein